MAQSFLLGAGEIGGKHEKSKDAGCAGNLRPLGWCNRINGRCLMDGVKGRKS